MISFINKVWSISMVILWFSLTAPAQINPGLYSDCNESDCHSIWFVLVKDDMTISEEIAQKKLSIGINRNSQDTLIKQVDGNYLGRKYALVQQNNSIFLVEKQLKRKNNWKVCLTAASSEMIKNWNRKHNMLTMSNRDVYNKYYLKKNYLHKHSKITEHITNAFKRLEEHIFLDQEVFLKEIERFEKEHLGEK